MPSCILEKPHVGVCWQNACMTGQFFCAIGYRVDIYSARFLFCSFVLCVCVCVCVCVASYLYDVMIIRVGGSSNRFKGLIILVSYIHLSFSLYFQDFPYL